MAETAESQLFMSSMTIGEIQAGIEITREQDPVRAAELESWLDRVISSHEVLSLNAAVFKECARLMHGQSNVLSEDALIAATAVVHRLIVVTRNRSDFDRLGVETLNPFEERPNVER